PGPAASDAGSVIPVALRVAAVSRSRRSLSSVRVAPRRGFPEYRIRRVPIARAPTRSVWSGRVANAANPVESRRSGGRDARFHAELAPWRRSLMRSLRAMRLLGFGILLTGLGLLGSTLPPGLKPGAYVQLQLAGVSKYLGHFTPVSSTALGDGWTRHDFDVDGGNGPTCIAGSPYSVFTRPGDPSKLLIFEQGGGACWQDFYNCNVVVENNALPPFPQVDQAGIWNRSNPGNPFADYSVVYLPYCDGSVFTGDNDVVDSHFPFGPVRFHRGFRNQSAGIDLAKATFPNATAI